MNQSMNSSRLSRGVKYPNRGSEAAALWERSPRWRRASSWRLAGSGGPPPVIFPVRELGLAVGLAPVVVLNVATQGTPVPFEGAWSFYMGNNPEADGTPYVRQGIDWQRLEAVRYRHGVDAADERRRERRGGGMWQGGFASVGNGPTS